MAYQMIVEPPDVAFAVLPPVVDEDTRHNVLSPLRHYPCIVPNVRM
jgi:hypothetical protein